MIAYLSSEFAVDDKWPSYAGGLGVLAGDILKEAGDESCLFLGISLFYSNGVFQQEITQNGEQKVFYPNLKPEDFGIEEVKDNNNQPILISVPLADQALRLKVLKKMVGKVPLYLLDANISSNDQRLQKITGELYENEWAPHIFQDVALGIGSVRLARALNLPIKLWHINDDHAGFNILERIREELEKGKDLNQAIKEINQTTVFTTHTPVAGAESLFSQTEITQTLTALFKGLNVPLNEILKLGGLGLNNRQSFSLSVLCLSLAGKINAVSQRHSQFSRKIWEFIPRFGESPETIIPITNAIHPPTWVSPAMDKLFTKYLDPNWKDKSDQADLWKQTENAPVEEFWQARLNCKKNLSLEVKQQTGALIPEESLILGFAKRFTPYKRPHLLLSDIARLSRILNNKEKPTCLIMSGKAHPLDNQSQIFLKKLIEITQNPDFKNRLIFLPNYNSRLAKILTAGADVWINLPQPPMEASGTSGMKALYNGSLNLMTSDGWWYETYNGENGWLVGPKEPSIENPLSDQETAQIVYDLLENEIQPLYFKQENEVPNLWIEKVKKALISTAAFLSSRRLLKDYQEKLYQPLISLQKLTTEK